VADDTRLGALVVVLVVVVVESVGVEAPDENPEGRARPKNRPLLLLLLVSMFPITITGDPSPFGTSSPVLDDEELPMAHSIPRSPSNPRPER